MTCFLNIDSLLTFGKKNQFYHSLPYSLPQAVSLIKIALFFYYFIILHVYEKGESSQTWQKKQKTEKIDTG